VEQIASFFRANTQLVLGRYLSTWWWSWRRRQHVHPKRRNKLVILHGVTSQNRIPTTAATKFTSMILH